jgi:hypothetical protein
MSTLLEIITAARDMLPGVAEAEARAAIERPANPNAAIFDQARAQAEQQGKSHFTFLGRAVETKGGETFDQLRARIPQGELDEGSTTLRMTGNQGAFNKSVDAVIRGDVPEAMMKGSPWSILDKIGIATTKSKAVPISEISQLKELMGKASSGGMSYGESVLEREGIATAKKWMKRTKTAVLSKPSTLLQSIFAQSENRGNDGNRY